MCLMRSYDSRPLCLKKRKKKKKKISAELVNDALSFQRGESYMWSPFCPIRPNERVVAAADGW